MLVHSEKKSGSMQDYNLCKNSNEKNWGHDLRKMKGKFKLCVNEFVCII